MLKKILFFLFLGLFLMLPVKAASAAGRFYLEPASGTYSSGEEFDVAVWVDPGGGEAVAIDGLIGFDTTRLEVVSVTEEAFFTQAGVGTNQGFSYTTDADNGRITIYSFATIGNFSVTTAGKIATIKFKAVSEGTATASFVCQSGGEDDSSIWDSKQADLVDCPSNGSGSYTISAAGGGASPTSTPTPTTASSAPDSPTATPSQLPETGIETPLIIVMIGGLVILGAGLLIGII